MSAVRIARIVRIVGRAGWTSRRRCVLGDALRRGRLDQGHLPALQGVAQQHLRGGAPPLRRDAAHQWVGEQAVGAQRAVGLDDHALGGWEVS